MANLPTCFLLTQNRIDNCPTGAQICLAGSYYSDCIVKVECAAGQFSNLAGQKAYSPCPTGTFSNVVGSAFVKLAKWYAFYPNKRC